MLFFLLLLTHFSSTFAEITLKIKEKDTLYSISKQYNIKIDEIKKINNLTTESLKIGQTIKLPVNEKIETKATDQNLTSEKLADTKTKSEETKVIEKKNEKPIEKPIEKTVEKPINNQAAKERPKKTKNVFTIKEKILFPVVGKTNNSNKQGIMKICNIKEKSIIHSSCNGKVVFFGQTSKKNANNTIIIACSNGIFLVYQNIPKNSVVLKKGENVLKKQLFGHINSECISFALIDKDKEIITNSNLYLEI